MLPRVQSEEVARCVAYIEDGDLWRWRLPGAKAFYAGLKALGLEYDANENPHIFDTLMRLRADELIEQVCVRALCLSGACLPRHARALSLLLMWSSFCRAMSSYSRRRSF